MKTVKQLLVFVFSTIILASCDSYLDTTPEDLRSPDQIFESYNSTQNAMFGVYSYLRTNPCNTPATYSTSEVDIPYTNVHTFNFGVWSASSAQYDKWVSYYQGIREATYFLQNVYKCPDGEITYETREQFKAEVRCVRAILYVELMRMYGPVVLLYDELVDFTADNLNRPRNTWDECVNWVSNELLELSENEYLPLQQSGAAYARMSKSIALAYRARILLTSASDLFNGNPMYAGVRNPDGTPLFPSKKDPQKWELARQAAKDVIDLGIYDLEKVMEDGKINPYKSYQAIFTTEQSKEMIFPFMETDSYLDKRLAPQSINGWGFGFSPTQEMVDLYAMKNGRYPITGYQGNSHLKPIIDASSGYSEEGFAQFTNPLEGIERKTFKMFIDREPRFYASILYGGLSWFVSSIADERIYVEMFKNGNNGYDASHNHSNTGYALVKFVMPDYSARTRNVKRELPFMRYAEILLNYIEATIEAGATNPGLLNDPYMIQYWDELRERAGLPSIFKVYPEAANNHDLLLELVRKERKIELAFEGMSFYDTRRWLTGEETESGYFYGMDTQVDGTRDSQSYPDAFFTRALNADRPSPRIFHPSFYLFPIPQSSLNKNHDLVQNYKL